MRKALILLASLMAMLFLSPVSSAQAIQSGELYVQCSMPTGIWVEGTYYPSGGTPYYGGTTVPPCGSTANMGGGVYDVQRYWIGECWAVNVWDSGVQYTLYGPRWNDTGVTDDTASWAWRTC